MRKNIIVWIVSVSAAAALSAGITAQVQSGQSGQSRVVSGDDFGFRVEGQRRENRLNPATGRREPVEVVTGHMVVKVNGQWVEAVDAGGGIRPVTQ